MTPSPRASPRGQSPGALLDADGTPGARRMLSRGGAASGALGARRRPGPGRLLPGFSGLARDPEPPRGGAGPRRRPMAPRVTVEAWEVPGRLPSAAGAARVPGRRVVMEEVSAEELDDEEQLLRRHRKEKKELQGDGRGPGAKGSVASVLVRPEGPPARSPGFSGFPPASLRPPCAVLGGAPWAACSGPRAGAGLVLLCDAPGDRGLGPPLSPSHS